MSSDEDAGRPKIAGIEALGGVSRRALRNAFTSKLPELTTDLRARWKRFRDEDRSSVNLDAFQASVTNLTRSAFSFKHEEVSAASAQLEAFLRGFKEFSKLPADADCTRIEALLEDVVGAAEALFEAETVADTNALDAAKLRASLGRPSVLIALRDKELREELEVELDLAGYEVRVGDGASSLEAEPPSLATIGLVVDADSLGGALTADRVVAKACEGRPTPPRILFVGASPLDRALRPKYPELRPPVDPADVVSRLRD
jgi:hypothetical protein